MKVKCRYLDAQTMSAFTELLASNTAFSGSVLLNLKKPRRTLITA
jgi:hypothetical protein